ncbi:MAG: UDP-4-amino-4-deoxy-L-arabinose aminotransferase [Planctomycetes bacterium]|nr:UDP-4-amino-4-deoxy-L-arabinose aminotransferase [Planctomycetota bacterium]MCB9903401.1 UDP-4-amino-4-deoxy-L-arabinose aminotransferase [Planctomycetota bacterium]
MSHEFLPFSRPSLTEDDIAAVADVLRSGWITTGPKCAEFERRFAEHVGAPGAVAVSSATGGMHVALHALDIGPGDAVVTPSMTWVSTVNLIALSGARPVFVDVDRDTLMPTADDYVAALTPRTKLVVPVHYAGSTVDLDPLREECAARGIALVEDAAHALGSYYKGAPIGSRGTAIFSFHAIKNLTTAEGGMIVSDDADFLERVRRLKFHGLGADTFDRETQGRAPQAQVQEPGFKYNLPDTLAVLGLRQLDRIAEVNEKRHRLAERYLELLADVPGVAPLGFPAHDQAHAWHLFVVRVLSDDPAFGRTEFMAELKQLGIGTGIHFLAAHTQRYYREWEKTRGVSLPNTEWNSERICSLPLFPDMELADVDRVVDAIRKVSSGHAVGSNR